MRSDKVYGDDPTSEEEQQEEDWQREADEAAVAEADAETEEASSGMRTPYTKLQTVEPTPFAIVGPTYGILIKRT